MKQHFESVVPSAATDYPLRTCSKWSSLCPIELALNKSSHSKVKNYN